MTDATCPLCFHAMPLLFEARDYRRPSEPETHVVRWCQACQYGRVSGADLTPEKVSDFYRTPYYTHDEKGAAVDRRVGWIDRLRTRIAWRFDAGRDLDASEGLGKTLLDIGCGNGTYMQQFAKAGFTANGIEPDPIARVLASQHGDVCAGTAEDLGIAIKGRRFDTVLLSHVLEHCIDPASALRSARDALAPDGRLIVEVPNNAALAFRLFRAQWPWADVPRHLHFFSEASLRAIIERAGLSVTQVAYVGYTRQFQPAWVDTQHSIWRGLGVAGKRPRFDLWAWLLLARTALAAPAAKYDSIRVHAQCQNPARR